MEKLLDDLINWDKEKELNHHKIVEMKKVALKEARAEGEKALAAHASAKAAHSAKRQAIIDAKQKAEDEGADYSGEELSDAGDTPITPENDQPKPELPTDVKVDGESDDDYDIIDIKEKVKAFNEDSSNKNKRIPDELINEAVKWRLNRNDC